MIGAGVAATLQCRRVGTGGIRFVYHANRYRMIGAGVAATLQCRRVGTGGIRFVYHSWFFFSLQPSNLRDLRNLRMNLRISPTFPAKPET